MVRAKFRVENLHDDGNGCRVITMAPVMPKDLSDVENKDFLDATPSGKLEMRVNTATLLQTTPVADRSASDFFHIAGEYYLDFSLAE